MYLFLLLDSVKVEVPILDLSSPSKKESDSSSALRSSFLRKDSKSNSEREKTTSILSSSTSSTNNSLSNKSKITSQEKEIKKKGKGGYYINAPEEFSLEFMNLEHKLPTKIMAEPEETLLEKQQRKLEEDQTLERLEKMDWNLTNASELTEKLLLEVPSSLYHSLTVNTLISQKMVTNSSYSLIKYAELYFQIDRRGTQISSALLDKLTSYQSDCIKAPLTLALSNNTNSSLALNGNTLIQLQQEAIACFQQILTFMNSSTSSQSSNLMSPLGDKPGSLGVLASPSHGTNATTMLSTSKPDISNPPIQTPANNVFETNEHSSQIAFQTIYYLLSKMLMYPIEFHDEIYLQLCKQLRKNPSLESTELGYQLFINILACIPPSPRLLPYLYYHFGYLSQQSSIDNKSKFIDLILKHLLISASSIIRHELPTKLEIEKLHFDEHLELTIKYIDGKSITLPVNSYDTIKQIQEKLLSSILKVPDESHYMFRIVEISSEKSNYASTSDNALANLRFVSAMSPNGATSASSTLQSTPNKPVNERLVPDQERIVDILAVWERNQTQQQIFSSSSLRNNSQNLFPETINSTNTLAMDTPITTSMNNTPMDYTLLLKIYLYPPAPDTLNIDSQTKYYLYHQLIQDVISGLYPHVLQDAYVLAALQLQVMYGDYVVNREIKELKNISQLYKIFCGNWLEKNLQLTLREIESKIIIIYKRFLGVNVETARSMFITYVQSWKLYGAKIFFVKGTIDVTPASVLTTTPSNPSSSDNLPTSLPQQNILNEIILAITPHSVVIIDPRRYSFLVEYPHDQLVSWGHSFDSFLLIVGHNKSNQTKSYFRTKQGKEIEDILSFYTHLLENKRIHHQNNASIDVLTSSNLLQTTKLSSH